MRELREITGRRELTHPAYHLPPGNIHRASGTDRESFPAQCSPTATEQGILKAVGSTRHSLASSRKLVDRVFERLCSQRERWRRLRRGFVGGVIHAQGCTIAGGGAKILKPWVQKRVQRRF
jgi:hypothetical protein